MNKQLKECCQPPTFKRTGQRVLLQRKRKGGKESDSGWLSCLQGIALLPLPGTPRNRGGTLMRFSTCYPKYVTLALEETAGARSLSHSPQPFSPEAGHSMACVTLPRRRSWAPHFRRVLPFTQRKQIRICKKQALSFPHFIVIKSYLPLPTGKHTAALLSILQD